MRILHVKSNFKKKKKSQKIWNTSWSPKECTRKVTKSQDYLLFPKMLAETFTSSLFQPGCSIVHSITWKFIQFPTEKGTGCARLAAGVALQHTGPSSAWSALRRWVRAEGLSPAGRLSACPAWDGAGSTACEMTAHRWVPQPGTALRLLQQEKQANNWRKHDALPMFFWASNKQAIYPNCTTHPGSSRNRTILLSSTKVLLLSYLFRVPHPAPFIPLLLPSTASCIEHRWQIELCWGIYTQALKDLPGIEIDVLQSMSFL